MLHWPFIPFYYGDVQQWKIKSFMEVFKLECPQVKEGVKRIFYVHVD